MNGAEVLRADGSGRFRVDGAITIESAPAVLASGSALLAAAGDATVEVDLAGLRYSNLPQKLVTLATLYGVDALLTAPAND